MLKLRKKDMSLLIVFTCLYFLSFLFQSYLYKQENYNQLSNELYTNNHAVFINQGNFKWLKSPLSDLSHRIIIEYDSTFRAILINNGGWSPPMISGQFFSNIEKNVKAEAVIGREMSDQVFKKNGIDYISYQGKNYEVTGVMGASFASSVDYLIFLSKPLDLNEQNKKLILDSENKSIINQITAKMKNLNPSVIQLESTQKGLSRTSAPFIQKLLKVEIYLLFFFSITAFLRYWYEKESKRQIRTCI